MKPNVIIELQPYLHDYLYHEFGCRPSDAGVNVTTANDIGKFIQAMVTVTDRPPKQAIKENPITLFCLFRSGTISFCRRTLSMCRNGSSGCFRII